MNKRTVGILILLAVVAFYAFGTGFTFFYRFLYALLLLLSIGLIWAWINLRGIEVQLTRTSNRGQVGGYLEGRVRIINRLRVPKSWLEVVEYSDLPGHPGGRGIALVRDQTRAWRTETYLSRRGVYQTGQIEVVSQDPFGLFRLRRRFLQPQSYIVFPATEPLPDLDPRFANLPSDSRITRPWDQVTTDVAAVREYIEGDSFRRIHWPYTARMNTIMVKEFDMGLSAEAWVLLDMQQGAHVGVDADSVDNSEELAVTIAASLLNRLVDLSLPVGFAANASQSYFFRPDSSPEHLGRLMEVLAEVRARGSTSLGRFIYDLRGYMSRFNSLMVITPSPQAEWVPALTGLRSHGVEVGVVFIDPQGFGPSPSIEPMLNSLLMSDIPTYVIRRGQSINDALRFPVGREDYSVPAPAPSVERTSV